MPTEPSQASDPIAPSLEATVQLLSAVTEGEVLSQRSLSERMGVALGLANALIRRCVKKGYIKISSAPARRYAYYLTPSGFAEKSRLVGEYIESSLSFFRSTRMDFAGIFTRAANCGQKRIVLVGAGELAEIALLAAGDTEVELVGVMDSSRNAASFHELPVFRSLDEAPGYDAILLVEVRNAQKVYDDLVRKNPALPILVPDMLHVSCRRVKTGS